MRNTTLWGRLLGVENASIKTVEIEEFELPGPGDEPGSEDEPATRLIIVAHARPHAGRRHRCGICGRRGRKYDNGDGRRRWRALDLGTVQAYVEADAPRITCREHGVVVALVSWARHGARHTLAFDQQVAWLATATSKTAATELMRVGWRTVGNIVQRVWDDVQASVDLFDGLRRIGIDEVSYKKGHRYITVFVDHDTRRLVWAAPGRDKATVHAFFDKLGPERSSAITHVTADGAGWIADVVTDRAPAAIRCTDPFHVVQWAGDALDQIRREVWNEARGGKGRTTKASTSLKRARYALWRNPEDLTADQQTKLAWIEKAHPRLHRAYLLKEGLRALFHLKDRADAERSLDVWLSWAARCRIPEFVELGRKIRRHRDTILAAIREGLSNGLVESTNTKIRLLTRIAFGFRSPAALIALAMLSLGGHRPALPGR